MISKPCRDGDIKPIPEVGRPKISGAPRGRFLFRRTYEKDARNFKVMREM